MELGGNGRIDVVLHAVGVGDRTIPEGGGVTRRLSACGGVDDRRLRLGPCRTPERKHGQADEDESRSPLSPLAAIHE